MTTNLKMIKTILLILLILVLNHPTTFANVIYPKFGNNKPIRCSKATNADSETENVVELGTRINPQVLSALKELDEFNEIQYDLVNIYVKKRPRQILLLTENAEISFESKVRLARLLDEFEVKVHRSTNLKPSMEEFKGFPVLITISLMSELVLSPIKSIKNKRIEKIEIEYGEALKSLNVPRPMANLSSFSKSLAHDYRLFEQSGKKSELLNSLEVLLSYFSASELHEFYRLVLQLNKYAKEEYSNKIKLFDSKDINIDSTIRALASIFHEGKNLNDEWIDLNVRNIGKIKKNWIKIIDRITKHRNNIIRSSVSYLFINLIAGAIWPDLSQIIVDHIGQNGSNILRIYLPLAGLSTGVVLPFFSQINTQHHVAESFDIKRDFKKIKRRFADQPELEMMVYLTNAFDRALFLKEQALETKVIKSSANIQKEY